MADTHKDEQILNQTAVKIYDSIEDFNYIEQLYISNKLIAIIKESIEAEIVSINTVINNKRNEVIELSKLLN